jgi:CTP:molybdopterin cytidylyltransferase MocA
MRGLTAVVLAAGIGRRLGRPSVPKALLRCPMKRVSRPFWDGTSASFGTAASTMCWSC